MMIARFALAAALGLLASAAPAADLRETHVEVRLPPAKGLQPAYRLIATDCTKAVGSVTPAGKLAVPAASVESRCTTVEK